MDQPIENKAELPAEGLRLMKLFLSIERKEDRDQLFQVVQKFAEKLKKREAD
jgi:hypothetical protein